MALRRDVQEQNQASRAEISKHAQAFRTQPMDFAWLLSELHSRGLDPLTGILAEFSSIPEQGGQYITGHWVTQDHQFYRFSGMLAYRTRAIFELEEWEQVSPKVSAHERGTGKTFAFLALEVLAEMHSRPNNLFERTREG
jgi:hypothetical protein